ncbi:MAG: MBOAT family protein [Thermoguttaceae bacterium]|nr:MBOAT family protein [Thermoguttaceae bacterium]
MVFSSTIFLFLFLPMVLFGYYVCLWGRTLRNLFLLAASLFFYAWGEPWFVFVMIFSIFGNWAFGLLIDKYHERRRLAKGYLIAALAFNISIIFIFKYLMFTLRTINACTGWDLSVPTIALPIGISFFTFQALSYVIDVYRRDPERGGAPVQKNPFDVALYIAFFPQLIAGPIVRYSTIAEQILHRKESLDDFSAGVCRFIVGLAKKAVIANSVAILADQIFGTPTEDLTVSTAWLGGLAYTFQIYFDFSGYSDMAIGLGRMFGFHFLENFNYPYISRSISEFWRRWHISLGTWFRDYVYFPLGGSRVSSAARLIFNLFVVWLLTGVWHGANWTFILWGLYFFVFISIEKMTGYERRFNDPIGSSLKWLVTFVLVVCGWVLFRSENLSQAFGFFRTMLGLAGQPLYDKYTAFYLAENAVLLAAAALCSLPLAKWFAGRWEEKLWYQVLYVPAMLVLLLLGITFVVVSTYNPFIYFNF